eukprot:scaffold177_cov334-Pavlova_lutheri.AAC.21
MHVQTEDSMGAATAAKSSNDYEGRRTIDVRGRTPEHMRGNTGLKSFRDAYHAEDAPIHRRPKIWKASLPCYQGASVNAWKIPLADEWVDSRCFFLIGIHEVT